MPDKAYPICLLPVRLETRFLGNELWVRIYPDQICINSHNPSLTPSEWDAGLRFQAQINSIVSDETVAEDENGEDAKRSVWRELARRYGPQRAAYIAKVVRQADGAYHGDLEQANENEYFKSSLMGLPRRFVVYAYRDDEVVHIKVGKEINPDLGVLPTPDAVIQEAKWMIDHMQAEADGMAIRIPNLTEEDKEKGFSRIIVVGLHQGSDSGDSTALEQIFDSHHYSTGLAFIEYGTPTNNTEPSRSGHSESTEDHEGSYDTEIQLLGDDDNERANARRLGNALGLLTFDESTNKYTLSEALRHLDRGTDQSDSFAKEVHEVLWPITGGDLLQEMLKGVNNGEIGGHFFDYVRGCGPLSSICVGDQPYGILPVTKVRRESKNGDSNPGGDIHAILLEIFQKWLGWINDTEKSQDYLPRAKGSHDPDKELVQILAMEPMSVDYQIRPFVDDDFVAWLREVTKDYVFNPEGKYGGLSVSPWYMVNVWAEEWKKLQETAKDWVEHIHDGNMDQDSTLLHLSGWWEGEKLESKAEILLHALTGSEKDQALDDFHNRVAGEALWDILKNVIDSSSLDPDTPDPDTSSIEKLFNISKDDAKKVLDVFDQETKCLNQMLTKVGDKTLQSKIQTYYLERLPSEALDRLLRETLDLCTHRLDAWVTSLATKRLQELRIVNPTGVYLGTYGWVENLKNIGKAESAGYIHAPSWEQAAAGAVLHNAYLTHADRSDTNPFRMNLNSERVRRASFILEGMRKGQTLGAMLGYQFERALHERSINGIYLDQYIDDFRAAFPMVTNKEDGHKEEVKEDLQVDVMAARNVVDGLALARWWENPDRTDIVGGDPKARDETLFKLLRPDLKDCEQLSLDGKHVCIEIMNLVNNLDAVSDVMMYETVYQSVRGNYERAGAALNIATGVGTPGQIESISTPLLANMLNHRVCILFSQANSDKQDNPRAAAEPRLASWFSELLGDLRQIKYYYRFKPSDNDEDWQVGNLGDLNINAIDLLYMSGTTPGGGETEIEQRIKYWVRSHPEPKLPFDTAIDLNFSRIVDVKGRRLSDAMQIGRQVLNLLSHCRILHPSSLCPPSGADNVAYTDADVTDFNNQFSDFVDRRIPDLIKLLNLEENPTPYDPSDNDRVIQGLLEASRYGIAGTIPAGDDDPTIVQKCADAVRELGKRLTEWGNFRDQEVLPEKMQALFGESFIVLPEFTPPDLSASAEYVVRPGEQLEDLSDRFQIPVLDLADVNCIDLPILIDPDQTILLPGYDRHRASEEDTLLRLARRNNTTVGELTEVNQLEKPALIKKGQILFIPHPGKVSTYKVQVGETFWSLAKRFRIPTRRLAASNKIELPDLLQIGQALRIPGYARYQVRAGETLWGLAPRFGMTVQALAKANCIYIPDLIREGQRLQVQGYLEHKVKKDDSLDEIAGQYHTTLKVLLKINQIKNPKKLTTGQILLIPCDLKRKVKAGETLWDLAKRYLTTPEALASLNNIQLPVPIKVHQTLLVQSFDELNQAFNQQDLLAGLDEGRLRLWLQQLAMVHEPLNELENTLTLLEAWQQGPQPALTLRAAQLPYSPENRWLALDDAERPDYDLTRDRGAISIVAVCNMSLVESIISDQEDDSQPKLAGLLLDQWSEQRPDGTAQTNISFQYDAPGAQAPQCILLAAPEQSTNTQQDSEQDTSTQDKWTEDDLAEILRDTMDLAKVRAIDYDSMCAMAANDTLGAGELFTTPAIFRDANQSGWAHDKVDEMKENFLKVLLKPEMKYGDFQGVTEGDLENGKLKIGKDQEIQIHNLGSIQIWQVTENCKTEPKEYLNYVDPVSTLFTITIPSSKLIRIQLAWPGIKDTDPLVISGICKIETQSSRGKINSEISWKYLYQINAKKDEYGSFVCSLYEITLRGPEINKIDIRFMEKMDDVGPCVLASICYGIAEGQKDDE